MGRQQRRHLTKRERQAIELLETQRRAAPAHQALRVVAGLVTLVVLGWCGRQLVDTAYSWGAFVPWAVVTLVALVWPLAFVAADFLSSRKQQQRVYLAAMLVTVSALGLLQVGWGLVALIDPEHAIGWRIPARSGGFTISDLDDARSTGTTLVGTGLFQAIVLPALCAVMVGIGGTSRRRQKPQPVEAFEPVAETVSLASGITWCCATLAWLVALVLGLIALIVPDGVTDTLAACPPVDASCSGDIWAAQHLPWVLTLSSLGAFGIGALAIRFHDEASGAIELTVGVVLHAGSVVAVGGGLYWLRWQDTTCSDGASRNCGSHDADFSFTEGWVDQVTLLGTLTYAVVAYLMVFCLLGRLQGIATAGTDNRP